jgi:hypothetical protein
MPKLEKEGSMRLRVFLLKWVGLLLATCGAGPAEPADLGTFGPGETLTFQLNDTVHVCNEELPYSIQRITEGKSQKLMLEHSCLGILGSGVDQFCENGQVTTVPVGSCSDAIICEDQQVNRTVRWDQQAYVVVTEDCAGQTIQHEEKQQVPAGRYQVTVQDWVEDHIEDRVVAEFSITY